MSIELIGIKVKKLYTEIDYIFSLAPLVLAALNHVRQRQAIQHSGESHIHISHGQSDSAGFFILAFFTARIVCCAETLYRSNITFKNSHNRTNRDFVGRHRQGVATTFSNSA